MPGTDEDILRDLLHRATGDLHAYPALASEIVTRQRRRRWRNRAVSAGVTGVAAGTVIGLMASTSSTVRPSLQTRAPASSTPAMQLTAAQRALYQLATVAAGAPRPSGRYVSLAEKDDSGGQVSQRTTVIDSRTGEGWTYQRGAGIPGELPAGQHVSLTEAQFAAVPTGPAALRDYLLRQAKQQAAAALKADGKPPQGQPAPPAQSDNDLVFEQAADMLWNPLVGPALRSALFKVLATTPDVQVNTNARDLAGRDAIEISRANYAVGQVVATYENPSNGSVLESSWDYPGNMGAGAVSYNISSLYLSVTSSNTLPLNPYGK